MAATHTVAVRISDTRQMLDLIDAMTDLAKAALPYRDTDPRVAAALDNLEAKTAALFKSERE